MPRPAAIEPVNKATTLPPPPSSTMKGPSTASGSEASRMVAGASFAETGMASSRPAVKEPQKSDTALPAVAAPRPVIAYVYSHVPKQFSACT